MLKAQLPEVVERWATVSSWPNVVLVVQFKPGSKSQQKQKSSKSSALGFTMRNLSMDFKWTGLEFSVLPPI